MNIKINNIELYYKKIGQGSPLILLHGNGEDHKIFDTISKKLYKHFTLYAIDSRNHGKSAKTDDYSYDTMASDIYSFINELGLRKVNIIGFSDGAIVSFMLAMCHIEVIDKMALLGVNLSPKDFTEESYKYLLDTYNETNDPLYKLMLEEPNINLNDIKNLDVPILLIAGEFDIFKNEIYTQMIEALPDARLMIMKNHDHDSYIINSDILYTDLLRFFSG